MTETRLIDVAIRNAPPDRVKAEIHGALGIHEAVAGSGVTVCHVATGKAVLRNVSHEVALRFIEDVQGIDWDNPSASRAQIEIAILKADLKAKA